MKVRWPGVALVVLLVIGTLLLKSRTRNSVAPATVKVIPSVILIADPSEANDTDDGCAVMFRAVRQAAKRGVAVAELAPNSNSDLLRQYHVLTVPTVTALFERVCKMDLEGIVAKHSFGNYVTERERTTWFKIKNRSYSQMEGREKLFEWERHKEPAPGWHCCELACELEGAQKAGNKNAARLLHRTQSREDSGTEA